MYEYIEYLYELKGYSQSLWKSKITKQQEVNESEGKEKKVNLRLYIKLLFQFFSFIMYNKRIKFNVI